MDYSSLVDTSLDLNIKPLRLLDDGVMKQEVQTKLDDVSFRRQMPAVNEETDALVEEINRVTAENQKLTQMLTVMCENYEALRKHLIEQISKNPATDADHTTTDQSKKRKADSPSATHHHHHGHGHGHNSLDHQHQSMDATNGPSESSSSDEGCYKKPREEHIKAKITRVYYRTEASDSSLIVKDGYQWRKYGQKVTRDNPSPRAYFKCSFAPTCPVKKKVQRSVEDQSILVATYEGEHTHPHPSKIESTSNSNSAPNIPTAAAAATVIASAAPTITLDLTKPKSSTGEQGSNPVQKPVQSPEFQQYFIEQMATSLTKDPGFKAALAAAISGKFLKHNQTEKWQK